MCLGTRSGPKLIFSCANVEARVQLSKENVQVSKTNIDITYTNSCRRVGMQVNISKMKVVVFSNKRNHNQHKLYFEDNILEEVADYKYPELTSTEI
jgi:uncharacterized membrane protein